MLVNTRERAGVYGQGSQRCEARKGAPRAKKLVNTVKGLAARKEHYKGLAYAVANPGARVTIGEKIYVMEKGHMFREQSQKPLASDSLDSMLKPYGWPDKAEGRTLAEFLAELLRILDSQAGEIRGLKHLSERERWQKFSALFQARKDDKVQKILASHKPSEKHQILEAPLQALGLKLESVTNLHTETGCKVTINASC